MHLIPTIHPFLDKANSKGVADYILFGAPLDVTTSNRRGTRFAPLNIRKESKHLDTFSIRSKLDIKDLKLCDLGDIPCNDVLSSLNKIESTINSIKPKFPIMLGGEHTITLGALRALKPKLVVIFDAHLDLRNELFTERYCHATYLRRAIEELDFQAIILGARALSREEITFAESTNQISYISALKLTKKGPEHAINSITKLLYSTNSAYLSIDMDVLDPAFAPGVGNPHPEGLTTTSLMDVIEGIMSKKFVGMDINEVTPHYDTGQTSITAGYVIMETLYSHILSE